MSILIRRDTIKWMTDLKSVIFLLNKNSYHSTLRFAQNSRINKDSIRIFLYLKAPMNRRIQSKFRTSETIIPIRRKGRGEKWGKNLWDALSLKIRDYAEHIMRFIRTSGGMESLIFSRWYHFLSWRWTRCITNWSIKWYRDRSGNHDSHLTDEVKKTIYYW